MDKAEIQWSEKICNRARVGPVCVCEWRGVKVDEVKYTDKKGGRRVNVVARHGVEIGSLQVVVSEWLPEGVNVESVKISFTKGQMLLLNVSEYSLSSGQATARGTLEVL